MQKNWNKLCSLVKNCKGKLSYQGLRLASLALLFMMSTGYAMADAGSSAITGAVDHLLQLFADLAPAAGLEEG